MLLAIALVLAQDRAVGPAPAADGQDIIVRAQRSGAALAACVARRCPTPEDVRLSMAHAEAQFADGRYRDAQATLRASIVRTRSEVARYPRLIAALHEASGTVARHDGDGRWQRRAMTDQAQVVRGHLPADDPQARLMLMQLGDQWLQLRDVVQARALYAAARRRFAEAGDARLAALATLRLAALDMGQGQLARADALLGEVAGSPVANEPAVRTLHAAVAARLAARRGDDAAFDRILATIRSEDGAPPVLLREGGDAGDRPRATTARKLAVTGRDLRSTALVWADIGYLVTATGEVADVEILRGSPERGWAAEHVARIAGRRYAPSAAGTGAPGRYRVERVTMRGRKAVPTGSIVYARAGVTEVETLDITRDAARPMP